MERLGDLCDLTEPATVYCATAVDLEIVLHSILHAPTMYNGALWSGADGHGNPVYLFSPIPGVGNVSCWPKKLSLQFFDQAGQARIVRAQPCHPLGIRERGRDVPLLATKVDSSRKQVEIVGMAA